MPTAIELDPRLRSEPPGPRRAFLALRAVGANQQQIADECNCARAVVSRVIHGRCTTELHRRIRQALCRRTGMPAAWLFAHAETRNIVTATAA
jgi:transcriptional regulator with XRE-family HTH domain